MPSDDDYEEIFKTFIEENKTALDVCHHCNDLKIEKRSKLNTSNY